MDPVKNITDLDAAGHARLSHYLPNNDGLILSQSNKQFSLFYQQNAVRDFLRATIRGDEEAALAMLREKPNLLIARGHPEKGITTDHSGRKYSGLTAFQIALCVGDEVMAMKMKEIFIESFPETAQAELDRQFDEIFPEGYEAHLKAEQASVDEFEREILDPLFKAFDGIDLVTNKSNDHLIEDLEAANRKEDNGSQLCQALNQFREAFTRLAQSEAIFNAMHFMNTLKRFHDKINTWYRDENDPHRWLQINLFWKQVIGFMQRFFPVNIGQAFCTGFFDLILHKKPLARRLNLHNDVSKLDINLFPLDVDPACRLGFDFAIYGSGIQTSGCVDVGGGAVTHGEIALFSTYIKQKQDAYRAMQPASWQPKTRSCIIL